MRAGFFFMAYATLALTIEYTKRSNIRTQIDDQHIFV